MADVVCWSSLLGKGSERHVKFPAWCSSVPEEPDSEAWALLLDDFDTMALGMDAEGQRLEDSGGNQLSLCFIIWKGGPG